MQDKQKPFNFSYAFVENEEQILELWEERDFFNKLREKNAKGKKYRFIDGPITANNPMGIHHAWGRTLKDAFLRYKAMNGYISQYCNGFDSQGLWVEVEVEKDLGFSSKRDIEAYGLAEFTEKCIERVKTFSKVITKQSKRLGQWMDWENSYYTYRDSNITGIWYALKKIADNGWLKQEYKPMPWCPRCSTSLSEHEMTSSYREVEHIALFAKAPLVEREADMLLWTTTPWTLTANVALAVNPKLTYVTAKIEGHDRPLIMGKTYFDGKFAGKAEVLETCKGSDLLGLHYETCFPDIPLQAGVDHHVIEWDEVQDDEGCGIVHIAPGCGAEDYALGQRDHLAVLVPVDEYGKFVPGTGFLEGKGAVEARDEIFAYLKEQGKLLYTHPFKHSYPVCWRCKTEILFLNVKEWAIAVDELRPRLIANAEKVKWNPPYQGKRMVDWLTNMSDWNISRKRFYGLPLPFYPCEHCGHLTVIGSKEELRERAVDPAAVDSLPHLHRPWIDDVVIRCEHCGKPVSRVPEVGDVWLDAGIVPFSTLHYFDDRAYWEEYFPAEYIVEMKEQVRLWFYSMLFLSTVLIDEPPYEQAGTHGMVTAEDGSRFSKTGNMIQFDEAADIIGADASRYIYVSSPMSTDVRFGFNLGDTAKRKLLAYWNMSTFFATYAEVDHPVVDTSIIQWNELSLVDQWLLAVVDEFVETATKTLEGYATKDIIQSFEKVVDDISNFYIRVNRRRFWKVENNEDKKIAYAVLFRAIQTITQVMAPLTPFITEYVWQNVILRYADFAEESVHLSDWPKAREDIDPQSNVLGQVAYARDVISLALKLRNEEQIRIRQPLENLYILQPKEQKQTLPAELTQIIQSEANVKNLIFLTERSTLETLQPVLNFKQAGAVLKKDVNLVKDKLAALSADIAEKLALDIQALEEVVVPGYETALPKHIFDLHPVPKADMAITEENGLTVALDVRISKALLQEGYVRDILRQCQVLRKEADFQVSDRIKLYMEARPELAQTIEDNKEYIESELLAAFQTEPFTSPAIEQTFDIEGFTVRVQMQLA